MSDKRTLEVRFGDVTKDNFNQLKRLHMTIFPVRYNEKFYQDVVQRTELKPVSQFVYHNDIVVGAVCCRWGLPEEYHADVKDDSFKGKRLYIMTLGVLAPYRGYGIGAKLIKLIIDWSAESPDVGEVFLHVQTNNTDAIDFYKKFGFEIVGTIPNYYKRITPSDCYVVSRKFNHPISGSA